MDADRLAARCCAASKRGDGRGRRARPAGAVAARRRGAERAALRLPRRRAARGAAHAGGAERAATPTRTSADDLGRLDPDAIAAVRDEAWPQRARRRRDARGADARSASSPTTRRRANAGWARWLRASSRDAARATRLARRRDRRDSACGSRPSACRSARRCYPRRGRCEPSIDAPRRMRRRDLATRDDALRELLRARLGGARPGHAPTRSPRRSALRARRRRARAAARCRPRATCCGAASRRSAGRRRRRVVRAPPARAHPSLHARRLRREIEPVEPRDFVRFLFDWQHVGADDAASAGPRRWPACWRSSKASRRRPRPGKPSCCRRACSDYAQRLARRPVHRRPHAVDAPAPAARATGRGARRRRCARRRSLLLPRRAARAVDAAGAAPRGDDAALGSRARARRRATSRAHGASFFDEIADGARLLRSRARGRAGRAGRARPRPLRQLRRPARAAGAAVEAPSPQRAPARRGVALFGIEDAGRWSLADRATRRRAPAGERRGAEPRRRCVEHVARIAAAPLRRRLLAPARARSRRGCRRGASCVRVYHRLEARGEIRGGRFIAGLSGEQFALPEAIALDARGAPPAGRRRAGLPRRAPIRPTCSAPSSPGRRSPRVAGARVALARRRAAGDERRR